MRYGARKPVFDPDLPVCLLESGDEDDAMTWGKEWTAMRRRRPGTDKMIAVPGND